MARESRNGDGRGGRMTVRYCRTEGYGGRKRDGKGSRQIKQGGGKEAELVRQRSRGRGGRVMTQ